MKIFKPFLLFCVATLFVACATTEMQITEGQKFYPTKKSLKLSHSFYLLGDAGNSDLYGRDSAISYLSSEIKKAPKNSTLIILGDNVYPKGIPSKKSKKYKLAKHRLKVQTDLGKDFPGKTIIIPGNHDWYNGLKGLKRQEKLVEDTLGKHTFQPENGCPLEKIEVNDDINIIAVDSHWYVTNWNNHPTINDECQIKTREKFFEELEGMIKKSQGKTTIIAIHHPIFTNGPHGGFYSFKSHMKPLPIVGSTINILRKTSGAANVDQQNWKYTDLRKRIINLSQQNERIIFVSGHEHSLQYIVKDNLPQIVSGSGSKLTATKNVNGGKFSYGTQGFARLDVFEDGSSTVHFYTAKERDIVYKANVFQKDTTFKQTSFPNAKLKEKKASIYTQEEVTKSGVYKFLWGERFRKYFGTKINAPTVGLDTLYGGLKPIRKGGGHQSESLRLEDKEGKQYVMRALRKNAVQYLQAVAFKDQYIEGQFEDTTADNLLMDIFTGSHPYAPFVVGKLADAVDIYHPEPILYYVPKQKQLGEFNQDFGDELYMIEARVADDHGDKAYFGFANEIISTDDLRKNLKKDEKYVLDEASYIKARLFDMLIGDWDRHQDQWRWAEFKENKKVIYRPVPRDRDQAFSKFSDGFLLSLTTKIVPALRGMKSYAKDLKDPRLFNNAAFPLDISLIQQSDKKVWNEQVAFLQKNITDNLIDEAFKGFPKEVNDESITDIKEKLKGRRKNLQKIADRYFNSLNEFQVVKGTNKDDYFTIHRLPNGKTEISVHRIKDGKKSNQILKRTYNKEVTKEIWIYGLDDDDIFETKGKVSGGSIRIKIIGGQNNDVYRITEKKNIKIYDHKSKKNTLETPEVDKKLTDDYRINVYDYKKIKGKQGATLPSLGFNPDDGIKIGIQNSLLVNHFERNPFTRKRKIAAFYYFATEGYELNYETEYANVLKNWNLGIRGEFNSPNYATNFFGYGINSPNPEAHGDFNFNRVRIGQYGLSSFLKWRGDLGAIIKIGLAYQNFDVENTEGRFITDRYNTNNAIFDRQQFLNPEISYTYKHSNSDIFPTLGIGFETKLGYTANLDNARSFSYINPSLALTHRLIPNGKLVFASKVNGEFLFGRDFNFYQAATIGGNEGLRGFRNQRFTGKNAFYQSTDIRWNIKSINTGFVPFNLSVYGGFDYGRVWGTPNELIINPAAFDESGFATSYGGGFYINSANLITSNLGVFNSEDGMRIVFSLGFSF
jgi:hypothetical protein